MKANLPIRALVAALFLALLVQHARCQTIIPGGNVSGTWTAAGSPYIITGNITIPLGDSLIVEPGVQVRFNLNTGLTVPGRLLAESSGDIIIFTSNQPNPQRRDWTGISVSGSGSCQLDHGLLLFGTVLECSNNSSVSIQHTRLSFPLDGHYDNYCTIDIHACLLDTIRGTGRYFTMDSSTVNGSISTQGDWYHRITLTDCNVWGNIGAGTAEFHLNSCEVHGNIYLGWTRNTFITANTIYGSISGGFSYMGGSWNVSENVLFNGAIHVSASPETSGSISNNTINDSPEYGIWISQVGGPPGWPDPVVTNNVVNGCAGSGIYVGIGGDTGSLNVSGNSIHHAVDHGIEIHGDYGGSSIATFHQTVTDNFVDSCGGDGIWAYEGCDEFILIGNTIMAAGGAGIHAQHLASYNKKLDVEIRNNLVISPDNGGILLNDLLAQYSNDSISVQIENNTIDHPMLNAVDISAVTAPVRVFTLKNNILTSSSGWGIAAVDYDLATVSYNNLWQNALGNYSGVTPGQGSIYLNPLYVDPEAGDFHLQSTAGSYHNGQWLSDPLYSPCIDAGDPASPYASEPLPNGNRINLGFEGNTAQASHSVPGLSGPVSGIWTPAQNPYYISGDIWIYASDNLAIQPGVEVVFLGSHSFSVYGTLQAMGTVNDSILFTAVDTSAGWRGLKFISEPSSDGHLAYCTFEYGRAFDPEPGQRGGAIYCLSSSPVIDHCTFRFNRAQVGGAIACYEQSGPVILHAIFMNNWAGWGGAIYSSSSWPIINDCRFENNTAESIGGAVRISSGAVEFDFCLFRGNTAPEGGGIGCANTNLIIHKCTLVENTSVASGGGLANNSSETLVISSILWNNGSMQMSYTGTPVPQVSYSDVQGGYIGTGNINSYPAFLDTVQHDYRLQWGSPCIDSGDPNPSYNDPDGTRADMGAFYYDQSMPVRILLIPYNAPIQIPAGGGSFQYAIQATNIESAILSALVWCNATMPSGSITPPVLGPVTISLGSGQTLSRVRTQAVPAGAPAGMYHYNAYAVAAGDTSEDSFVFTKLGAGDWESASGDWSNTGEFFEGQEETVLIHPSSFRLHPCHPNPFNATTVLSYQLPVASLVSLRVYDTAGRLATELVNGWRDAGTHEVTFNGSALPSGIYLYRLSAGDWQASGKMVLVK